MRTAIMLVCAIGVAAAPSGADAVKPDFSAVRSRADAEALVAKGELVPILLFPAEFGGEDRPENRTYVPPFVVEIRARLIGTIGRMLDEGSVNQMTVHMSYHGKSFIPASIQFRAFHSEKGGSFEPVITVW
ncbi:hypothetical protein HL653_03135 [Sphingomonas sp. AP4-R1]|uniref:hypothetical protein n=1 Tax=Sphingomonas sp. AP4-R1 TaxID=2735134 RepID=UPI001493978A|nr:hypothetical protein [Sphingomonas sp. AP4-R1]QJU56921.1 hypothetical protein HL653_03135 [Sphingomonas sp. AP4-R1]